MTELETKLLAQLKGLLSDVDGLMGESNGVYGLHLNGDASPWSELEEGGRFERLSHMSSARAAIAEAEAAQQQAPQPYADGWIPWAGGECPIGDDVLHQVRFRDGGESNPDDWASDWRWLHEGRICDIVAYRIAGAPK